MTVSITTSQIGYNCDGVASSFTYPFKILQDSDLTVLLTNSSNVTSVLVLDVDYTVTGAGNDSGGTVVPTTPADWATGMALTLKRNTALTQDTDFTDGEAFSAESIEGVIDKNVLKIQELDRRTSSLESGGVPAATRYYLVVSSYIGLADAITQIGSTRAKLVIDKSQVITSDLTVPSNIDISDPPRGVTLTIASGKVLTINSPFNCGAYQVFAGSGSVSGLKTSHAEWFGLDGSNDEVPIQKAVNAAKTVIFQSGSTYVFGGTTPVTASTANLSILANSATFKFKGSATSWKMFSLAASGITFDGGIFDGENVDSGDAYTHYGISVSGDSVTIRRSVFNNMGLTSINAGAVNNLLVDSIRIIGSSNSKYYGVFGSSGTSVVKNNRVINSFIDMSLGNSVNVQPILFTKTGAGDQQGFNLSGNTVYGGNVTASDQTICMAVRGNNGIFANNIIKYGGMGISEGGSGTVYIGNTYTEPKWTGSYGIEPSGSNITLTSNIIDGAAFGVSMTGTTTNASLTSNTIINSLNSAVRIQTPAGGNNKKIRLIGNTLNAIGGGYVVSTTGPVDNLLIALNDISGVSSASGRGIFIANPSPFAAVYANNNFFSNLQRCMSYYSIGTTISGLFANGNAADSTGIFPQIWNPEGSPLSASPIININAIRGSTGIAVSYLDQVTNLLVHYGVGSPEGVITAGIGSVYYRTNGGAATTLYIKESGTGNTGWVAK